MASQPETQETLYPLSPCTPSDLPQMARVYNSSFASNPSQSILFPTSMPYSSIEKWFIDSALPKFSQPELHFFKITDSSTGELAGFVRWGYPYTPPPPADAAAKVAESGKDGEKGEEVVKKEEGSGIAGAGSVEVVKDQDDKPKATTGWPEGTNLPFADEKFGALMEWRKKYVKWEETYICYLLCVDPKYQRKGFASRLLNVVLDRADAEGRKAYIEASPVGYHVYYKLGFRVIDQASIFLENYGGPAGVESVSVAMMREPVKKQD